MSHRPDNNSNNPNQCQNKYDTYVKYFYNSIEELNTVLHRIVEEYREPTQGRFFSVKHNITDELGDVSRARLIFVLYILNAYIASCCKEYKINAIIGTAEGHILLKYEYLLPHNGNKAYTDSLQSYNYKMMEFYVRGCSARSVLANSEKGLECKIIIA